jgi:predicted membrane protein
MNRQRNPLVGLIFFFIALSFIFGNFDGFAFIIPFIFPVIIFFVILQIISQAKKAQQYASKEKTMVQAPEENRFERDFSKRRSSIRKLPTSHSQQNRKSEYFNVSNLPGAHIVKCPKCGAEMDDRYDYCFKCKSWLKQ